ncbi:hypothetical protein GCM10022409_21700 [Hymenobacter glaciei]|uniref:Uncharacterized protein n=1 Tax=Hymenobacter glaciei TaxID=877209 RepID=A0ABP7U5S0_9BACT
MRKLVLGAVFTAMISLNALGSPPSLVVVQFHGRNNTITISRGPGKTETMKVPEPRLPKNQAAYSEQLLAIFTSLYTEGYEIKNSTVNNITSEGGIETVTYVFVKP